jgi:hypothetical protein
LHINTLSFIILVIHFLVLIFIDPYSHMGNISGKLKAGSEEKVIIKINCCYHWDCPC